MDFAATVTQHETEHNQIYSVDVEMADFQNANCFVLEHSIVFYKGAIENIDNVHMFFQNA